MAAADYKSLTVRMSVPVGGWTISIAKTDGSTETIQSGDYDTATALREISEALGAKQKGGR